MKQPTWVLQEATLLRSRVVNEGAAFRLFIVIDARVEAHEVWKAWFAPLDLKGVQRFKLAQPVDSTLAITDEIRRQLALTAAAGDDYFSRLAAYIDNQIAPMKGAPLVPQALAQGFRIDDVDWKRIVGEDKSVDVTIASACARATLAISRASRPCSTTCRACACRSCSAACSARSAATGCC